MLIRAGIFFRCIFCDIVLQKVSSLESVALGINSVGCGGPLCYFIVHQLEGKILHTANVLVESFSVNFTVNLNNVLLSAAV